MFHRLTADFMYIHSPNAVALGPVNTVNPEPRYLTDGADCLNKKYDPYIAYWQENV